MAPRKGPNCVKEAGIVIIAAFDSALRLWQGAHRLPEPVSGVVDSWKGKRLMAKPEWGTKRSCPKCGVRFYDLGKEDPVACISCGNLWNPEPILKSKQAAPYEDIKKADAKPDSDLGDDLEELEVDEDAEISPDDEVDIGTDDDLGVDTGESQIDT